MITCSALASLHLTETVTFSSGTLQQEVVEDDGI